MFNRRNLLGFFGLSPISPLLVKLPAAAKPALDYAVMNAEHWSELFVDSPVGSPGVITSISIISPGSGYSALPAFVFNGSGGATAKIEVSDV